MDEIDRQENDHSSGRREITSSRLVKQTLNSSYGGRRNTLFKTWNRQRSCATNNGMNHKNSLRKNHSLWTE